MDLNGLVGRLVPEAVSLIGDAMQHARQPEEYVDGLAGWPVSPIGPAALTRSHLEDLIRRNGEVAAGLGACDCWGEQKDCEYCAGLGAPGWLAPDKQHFDKYVEPTLVRVADVAEGSRFSEAAEAPQGKEDDDD